MLKKLSLNVSHITMYIAPWHEWVMIISYMSSHCVFFACIHAFFSSSVSSEVVYSTLLSVSSASSCLRHTNDSLQPCKQDEIKAHKVSILYTSIYKSGRLFWWPHSRLNLNCIKFARRKFTLSWSIEKPPPFSATQKHNKTYKNRASSDSNLRPPVWLGAWRCDFGSASTPKIFLAQSHAVVLVHVYSCTITCSNPFGSDLLLDEPHSRSPKMVLSGLSKGEPHLASWVKTLGQEQCPQTNIGSDGKTTKILARSVPHTKILKVLPETYTEVSRGSPKSTSSWTKQTTCYVPCQKKKTRFTSIYQPMAHRGFWIQHG